MRMCGSQFPQALQIRSYTLTRSCPSHRLSPRLLHLSLYQDCLRVSSMFPWECSLEGIGRLCWVSCQLPYPKILSRHRRCWFLLHQLTFANACFPYSYLRWTRLLMSFHPLLLSKTHFSVSFALQHLFRFSFFIHCHSRFLLSFLPAFAFSLALLLFA